jgi:hypothetical protein
LAGDAWLCAGHPRFIAVKEYGYFTSFLPVTASRFL